jgi:ABC-type nitrate/sulfonate/bicarbonate transport system substrate-binding protein
MRESWLPAVIVARAAKVLRSPALVAACVMAALLSPSGPAGGADKLVLQLHGPAQFEFAGYLAALWRGFYRDAGLDVELKAPAATAPAPTDAVREVTEGRAQFGTGTVQLLVRAAQGLPLEILAPVFQQSGAMVYYRADGDFASPGALADARIARLPASNILDIELRTALLAEGIDPDKPRSVTVEPGQILDKFAKHEIDAAIGSAWDLPWQAKEKGIALKSFNPASYRVEFYGDSLFTLQRFAAAQPDTVRRFREASLSGWEYALQHPEEIVAGLLERTKQQGTAADPAGFAHYQAEIAKKLARYPAVPLGASNPERWNRIEQAMVGVAAMTRPAALDTVLYRPRVEEQPRDDAPALVSTGAGIAAAAIIAWFLWRRLRRGRGFALAGQTGPMPALAEELRDIVAGIAEPLEQLRGPAQLQPQLARACKAAIAALNRLRAVARRLDAAPPLAPRPSDLNAALAPLSGRIRRGLPRGTSYRLSLQPGPWLCDADPEAVAAAVVDLARAATDAIPKGGDLTVGTRHFTIDAAEAAGWGAAAGEYVRVTVRDSGPGLSPERLARMLDPETTADPAILAATNLTRGLGGFARVETVEGVGTAVHLYFRRSAAAEAAEPAKDAPAEDHRAAKAAE